jgi:uncharacterized protein (TIGR03382 family)
MRAPRPVLLAVMLGTSAAQAAGPADFSDDVESGQVFTNDGGAWDGYEVTRAGIAIVANAASAHRGNFGLQVIDTDFFDGGASGTSLSHAFASATTGTVYLRFWMRVTPQASSGSGFFFFSGFQGMSVGLGASTTANAVSLINDGFDSANTYYRFQAGAMSSDQWHLFEVTLDSSGAMATDQMRVDGVTVLWSPPVSRTGLSATGVGLGEAWADNSDFVGTLDFDDFRTSAAPMASALSVALAISPLRVGDCVALSVGLLDFDGGAAPAPYAFLAALSADAGTFHGDVSCSTVTQQTSASFAAATAHARPLWFRARSSGSTILSAEYVDFLPGALPISIAEALDAGAGDAGAPDAGTADAGTPDAGTGARDGGWSQPADLRIGCDCSQSGAPPLWLVALLAALRRRRTT